MSFYSGMSESEAGMSLAVDAAKKLGKVDPTHELLDLFNKNEEPDWEERVWDKFQERFGKEGLTKEQRGIEPAQAHFWANYFFALKEACEGYGITV